MEVWRRARISHQSQNTTSAHGADLVRVQKDKGPGHEFQPGLHGVAQILLPKLQPRSLLFLNYAREKRDGLNGVRVDIQTRRA